MDDAIRLKEACKILNGFAFKSNKYVDSGIRIIRIANVQKGYVEDEKPAFYPDSEETLIRDYMLEENDLLLSLTGNVGRVALLDKKWLPAALNQRVACLRIKDGRIIKDYLYFALLSDKFENDCIKSSKGIAQKNMSTEWLKDYEIPLPSEQRQREIVSSLKHLSAIIKNKTEQIQQLDNLVKARFVEMFSESKCGTKKLNEITDIITKGTTPTTAGFEFTDSGINFFKIESITEDHTINLNKVAHVSEECHKALRRSQLREGDVLFSIAGAIGRTAIISKGDLPGNNNQALAIIRLSNDSGISQKYLISALDSPEVFEQCRTKKRGVAQINLSLQDVGNIEIPIPSPMEQKTFELFAKQIDKSKFAVQKSLEKTQLLFDSLMQEYFD